MNYAYNLMGVEAGKLLLSVVRGEKVPRSAGLQESLLPRRQSGERELAASIGGLAEKKTQMEAIL